MSGLAGRPPFGLFRFVLLLDFWDGGFFVIINGAVTGLSMFKNFEAVGSADVAPRQYRWASFLVMYLRVSVSREDVFVILIN